MYLIGSFWLSSDNLIILLVSPGIFSSFGWKTLSVCLVITWAYKDRHCSCFQVDTLELLIQQGEDHWLPWQQKRPLLQIACERGAWNCVKFLVSERSEEINQCYDEYYPIHQAALHNIKFLDLLIRWVLHNL